MWNLLMQDRWGWRLLGEAFVLHSMRQAHDACNNTSTKRTQYLNGRSIIIRNSMLACCHEAGTGPLVPTGRGSRYRLCDEGM